MKLASSPATSRYQIQDWIYGCGGVLGRMPRNIDIEGDNKRIVCRVTYEAECRKTTMNYAKKYSGVPLKRASVSGKS